MLALVLEEDHAGTVAERVDSWVEQGVELHAPLLAQYEVTTVLTRDRVKEKLTSEDAVAALEVIDDLEVTFDVMQDNVRVVEIAVEQGRHKAYDAVYLELAERLGTELWTLDGPLVRNAGDRHAVRLIK